MNNLSLLQVQGRHIVNEAGQNIYLRGINLGGWLMMEGYLLHGRNIPEHLFKKEFSHIHGNKELDNFQKLYRQNFITAQDIRKIKSIGATCVRVPFNYRLIAEDKEWTFLDNVIAWCRKENIYCILDLHAAPGAQNKDWHSDSSGEALFWENTRFQQEYLSLWQQIAGRYRQEKVIAGYDILNEPVIKNSRQVQALYRQTTKAIRAVDPTHILFIEGNRWGQELEFLGRPWDKNLVYSIHVYLPLSFTFNFQPHLQYPGFIEGKYWDKKQLHSYIAPYYHLSEQWQVPVYVGEFGINFRSPRDYGELRYLKDVLDCFDRFGFHWSYWTYKAIAGEVQPDGIYQYLHNPPWVRREGPTFGWENFAHLWETQKSKIAASWKTEKFIQNKYIAQLLSGYCNNTSEKNQE